MWLNAPDQTICHRFELMRAWNDVTPNVIITALEGNEHIIQRVITWGLKGQTTLHSNWSVQLSADSNRVQFFLSCIIIFNCQSSFLCFLAPLFVLLEILTPAKLMPSFVFILITVPVICRKMSLKKIFLLLVVICTVSLLLHKRDYLTWWVTEGQPLYVHAY